MSAKKIKRLYISKSKQGNPDDLALLRKMLKSYDVEVVEFFGGRYTPEILLNSDIVLVLPHRMPKLFNYDFTTGKGQYSEIITALSGTKPKPVHGVICLGDEIYISERISFTHLEKTEVNWTDNYGHVYPEDMMRPLHIETNIKLRSEPGLIFVSPEEISYNYYDIDSIDAITANKSIKPMLALYKTT